MRAYEYTMLGAVDEYGQMTLDGGMTGTIRMAIYVASQAVTDTVLYSQAQYIGLTNDDVTDRHIIHYEGQKLKVLYVQPRGRHKQVYLAVTP
jgi:hypothetical protein